MLTIQNLTIKDLKNHILIENLSFSLGANDKLAIIGEEGNGKSTLLKFIYHKDMIEKYTSISGKIDMDYQRIGYMEQRLSPDWYQSNCVEYLLKEKAEDEIEFEKYNELAIIEGLCVKLQIPIVLLHSDQLIASLSGGEKVKLQLLKLIYQDCDLLLLDEPTNDLDIRTLKWLETFIKGQTVPIVFISHDETLLSNVANRILHLEQLNKKSKCRVSEFRGNYQEYVDSRENKHKKEIQIAHKEKIEYMKKKEKLNDVMNAVHDALNDTVRNPGMAAMLKKKMSNIKAQEKRFDKESFSHVDSAEDAIDVYFGACNAVSSKIILQTTVEVKIGERCLLKPYEIDIRGQDKVLIIGDNGCGKTQLMKQIYDHLKSRKDINLGYMPQNYMDLVEDKQSAMEFLLEEGDRDDVSASRELLGRMKFTSEEMLKDIQELSEGQKAKLYILRFIKYKCNVLLMDEPTRNLSPLSSPTITKILDEYDGCIIAVSHDRKFIKQVAKRVFIMEKQTITEPDNLDALF